MSNRGLNSNVALEENKATSSSVILSGARREKEAPDGLDIEDYRRDPENSYLVRNSSQGLSIVARRQFDTAALIPRATCW